MGLILDIQRSITIVTIGTALILSSAAAQKSIAITEPAAPLLPQRFGGWKRIKTLPPPQGSLFGSVQKDALAECDAKRTEAAEYMHEGNVVQLQAIEFGDRTGAVSAFTLSQMPGMQVGRLLGASDAVGTTPNSGGKLLFTQGASLVLADFGSSTTAADIASLKPLSAALPKVVGNQGVAPLLPTLLPREGFVNGSIRYALGPLSYVAEGGVLPANALGWNRDLEAVTAQYDDARGKESLTLLMYPTPTIAEGYAKSIDALIKGGQYAGMTAIVRREGLLVMMASGTFSSTAATQMLTGIHLKEMTFNQDVQPAFPVVARQTFSLLTNIAILSGILMAAAVLLGLFLGVGRATFRVMRGKPAAVEPEFLSLHLSPQSKPAQFQIPSPETRDEQPG